MDLRKHVIAELLTATTVADCVNYQMKDAPAYLKEEMFQNIWLWLHEYDIAKLWNAYEGHHLNALVTRYISNNYWSKNSPFHKTYRKMQELEADITDEVLDLAE